MSLFWSIVLALGGLVLVVLFSEQLVKAVVGTSLRFNVSAFLLSVIFIGFDPENLGVGAMGSYEDLSGIATGSIIGAAMVAMALALGITALFSPLKFEKIPKRILSIPVLSVLLFAIVVLDKVLSRLDGIILLVGYSAAIIYLIYLNKKGYRIKAGGEVAETLEKENLPGKWKSAGLFLISLVAIVGGSEMLVSGSEVILQEMNLSDTVYGMTILAFLVSVEEIARELPAALKGKPDISLGNVIGSVLAFFLFNAGIIALVSPVEISDEVLRFFLPLSGVTILFIVILLALTNKISRWAGTLLLGLYLAFIVIGFLR
ncbi:MAG: sodium:calcium antiporter [Bacteroidota bacterium]